MCRYGIYNFDYKPIELAQNKVFLKKLLFTKH